MGRLACQWEEGIFGMVSLSGCIYARGDFRFSDVPVATTAPFECIIQTIKCK